MLVGPGLDGEKIEVATIALGVATVAVEDATVYAQERRQLGRPVSGFRSVRHALADAHTRLEACRTPLYRAASLAQQILDAYGCADEYDMQRHVSDALVLPIFGGSSSIQCNNIAKQLGSRSR
jgi:alkylation response protein AidB-like acyl-CoA dehydrogenase